MNPHIPHHKVVMVPRASIISESEVSIRFFVYYFHPVTQQYESKSTSVIKVTTMKKYDGAARPSYHLKLKYPLSFCVSYVRLITQQYESRTL